MENEYLFLLWYLLGLIANWRLFWGLVKDLDEYFGINFFDRSLTWKAHVITFIVFIPISSLLGVLLFPIYRYLYNGVTPKWWHKIN